jgi:tetratricopeptide (TPR) repeat protein
MNPACFHDGEGLLFALNEDHQSAVREFEEALRLGVPHDDEMHDRFFLGESYLCLAASGPRPWKEKVHSARFGQAIDQMEKALQMDREGGYGYFAELIHRARLGRLDLAYDLAASTIAEDRGRPAAIMYLQQKVGLCSHLPSCPLLHVLLKLAELYALDDQKESAKICLRQLLASDVVDRGDEKGDERALRQEAGRRLGSM